MHEKKLRMLEQSAASIAAAAAKAETAKKRSLKRAGAVASMVTAKASDVGETVSAEAGVLGERAAEIRVRTGQRLRRQPWIVGLAAAVLFLSLGISVGRRYFSPA
jgi:hypothetical protein